MHQNELQVRFHGGQELEVFGIRGKLHVIDLYHDRRKRPVDRTRSHIDEHQAHKGLL